MHQKAFILNGRDLETLAVRPDNPLWPLKHPLQTLETILPGVFAADDVRAGSVKRLAFAFGRAQFQFILFAWHSPN